MLPTTRDVPVCGTRQARKGCPCNPMRGAAYGRELLNAADRQRGVPFQFQPTTIEHAGQAPMLCVAISDRAPLDGTAYAAAGWSTCGSSASST